MFHSSLKAAGSTGKTNGGSVHCSFKGEEESTRWAGERAKAGWDGSDESMLDEEGREELYVSADIQEGGLVQPWRVLDLNCSVAQLFQH